MKKMKSMMSLFLSVFLLFFVSACSSQKTADANAGSDTESISATAGGEAGAYKIAMMTATVTQGDEVYTTVANLADKHDNIVHYTMPDNLSTELETMISTTLSIVEDESVKALIFPGGEGTVAMMEKVKEVRPDIFLWAISPQEDSSVIAAAADVCFNANLPETGKQMAQAAKDMGCKRIFHFSFPRHMSQQILVERHDIMKEEAEKLGLEFIDVTTPDPTSDAGVTGCQQFVLEETERLIDEYGADSGFFGTNPTQLEPMIKVIMEKGAYFLMPQDPSPFTGYPSALGIEISQEMKGDYSYAHDQIRKVLSENNMSGHCGNWSVPLPAVAYTTAYRYACDFVEGKTNGRFDREHIDALVRDFAGDDAYLTEYFDTSTEETLNNYLLITCEYMTY